MNRIIAAILFLFLGFSQVKADEGMWLPMLIKRLNQQNLQKLKQLLMKTGVSNNGRWTKS